MIHLVFDFLLNISKEIIIAVASSYFVSLLNKKKKNHPTDQVGNGSSSDK